MLSTETAKQVNGMVARGKYDLAYVMNLKKLNHTVIDELNETEQFLMSQVITNCGILETQFKKYSETMNKEDLKKAMSYLDDLRLQVKALATVNA